MAADESPNPALTRLERVAISMGRLVNERPALKRLQQRYLFAVTRTWIRPAIAQRVYVSGLDPLLKLDPPGGIVLSANHRSFFDMYVVMLALSIEPPDWLQRMYFPVRANFFYEHPLGLAVNGLIGGGVMYPPIFRDRGRAALNKDAIDRVVKCLDQRGSIVGVHPEGTRGKGPDPYELLPAQPGVGQIVLHARPTVIPIFINGLPNSLGRGISDTWRKNARREHPTIICIGAPLDYSEYTTKKPRAALYKRCADKMLAASATLAEHERELRAACARGDIDDDDRGWLTNRGRD